MDEDSNDAPRVTRARTRRFSALDADSRSSTPLFDATVERASPRPVRRTRLNSATIDLRTPTRSTRLSVARGETPEPITPSVSLSAKKRATRTPAKSARKLPVSLKEELPEEGSEEPMREIKKEFVEITRNTATPSPSVDSMVTPNITPTDDRRITRAMSKTPPDLSLLTNPIPKPQFDINNTPKDKQTKEVIENVDTSPVNAEQLSKSVDGENETSSITSSLNNSKNNNNKRTRLQVKLESISMDKPGDSPAETDTPESKTRNEEKTVIDKGEPKAIEGAVQEDSDTPTEYITPDVSIEEAKAAKVSQKEPDKDEEHIIVVDDNNQEKTEPQAIEEPNEQPVDHNVNQIQRNQEVAMETDQEPDSQTERETSKSLDDINPVNINNNEAAVVVQAEETNEKEAIAVQDDEPDVVDNDVIMEELVVPPEPDSIVEVIEDIPLPALTPRIMSRVMEAKPEDAKQESVDFGEDTKVQTDEKPTHPITKSPVEEKPVDIKKKSVDFGDNNKVQADEKPIYPKTPARRMLTTNLNILEQEDVDTKTETPLKSMLKKRLSSTPLAKSNESNVVNPPPLQIDVIEAIEDVSSKSVSEIQSTKENRARRLVSEDEEEDDEEEEEGEEDDERDGDPGMHEFFDNEVEVVENYVSGDSMDSSERREIQENQIPHDGESVGSQDTTEEESEESEVDNLSFIVSDNEVEEVNDDDDDIEELCFSPVPDSVDSGDDKGGKKRRRIIVHDTSDEEENQDDDVFAEKEDNRNRQSLGELMNKSKDVSGKESKMLNESKEKSFVKDSQDVVPEKSLDKAASVKGDDHDDREIEEVHSSSDEGEEHEHEKSVNNYNKSIYEVLDSSLDECRDTNEDNLAESPSPNHTNNQHSPEKEQSILKADSPTPMAKDTSPEDTDTIPDTAEKAVEFTSKSSAFHNREKREDEAALLDELSSCKLTHLQQMFNPLQKARRQTLYHQGPEVSEETDRKPKMKRRSEQLNSDVKPSQSFIETLAEEKSQRLKRKHMSKSFCGAADDLDTSAVHEVKSKKAKNTSGDEQVKSSTDDLDTSAVHEVKSKKANNTSGEEQVKSSADEVKSKKAKNTSGDEQVKSSTDTTADLTELKAPAPQPEPVKKPADAPKDTAHYMEYCESILLAANEAMLEQKKQRVASGKKTKTLLRTKPKTASDALELPPTSAAVPPVVAKPEFEKPTKIKKDVKRLQATKQAVKTAMQLLVPELAIKEPQSLARKLSPQPPAVANAKNAKGKKQNDKRKKPQVKVAQVSPAKSSDEENRHAVKRIKTSAGYFVESEVDSDGIELIKTRSGFIKSEPCTPKQKYFKEIPATPHSRSGFVEHAAISKAAKKKVATGGSSNVHRNPATESALRFKREIFGRSTK